MAVRDGKTGFVFFNIEGHLYDYDPAAHSFSLNEGRLLVSARVCEQAWAACGRWCGRWRNLDRHDHVSGRSHHGRRTAQFNRPSCRPGAVGIPMIRLPCRDPMSSLAICLPWQQFGSSGTQVGLAVGTTSCNNGNVDLNWFALPQVDHPVIPQNLYRMSGGATNTERFEQVGQSWLKHAFTALTGNACGFGCNGVGGTHLGVGCSDPVRREPECEVKRAWVHAPG